MNPGQKSFYVTGGTLRGDASCYVPRQADADLLDGLKRGEFCYVLTSRQMGKSSLMVRTAQRLRGEGIHVAVLDLTAIGQNLTAEQWYDGLLGHLGRQLRLEDELEDFWQDHERLAPLQRFMRAVREVVLPRCQGQVVVFVDEIDAVHSLPFSTDEFFAAIRECYNRRSEDAELSRLTFCLLGVATPSDLIRDARTTPFNIGRRIELCDFAGEEAAPLARGLGRDERLADRLLKRVLYWTGGHPYLTQRLCLTVAQDASITGPAGVDRVCEDLFLSHRARERDDNLLFVRERILRSDVDRAGLLDLYHQVRRGRRVRDEEHSALASVLRLSGVARVVEGYLWVRNRIYYRVFDREWVQANMPDAEKRRQRRAYRRGLLRASVVAAVLFAMAGAVLAVYLDWYVWDRVSYFNTFAKRKGMYEGVGPLSPADVAARAISLRFHRKGRYGPVVRVEAVDSRRKLNPRHNLATYLRRADENTTPLLRRECQWEVVVDNQNQVVQEKARDKLGRLVWAFIYIRLPGMPVRGHFVGSGGYLQDQRSSKAEYVEIEYTPEGFERVRRYYDHLGERRPGPDSAYGIRQEYDWRGLVIKMESLDIQDRPMIDTAGNTGMINEYNAMGNLTRAWSFDTEGRPKAVNDGYFGYIAHYDKHGLPIEILYLDEAGKLQNNAAGYARSTSRYDKHGNMVEEAYFDPDGKPAQHRDGYARYTASYDNGGNPVDAAYFDREGKPARAAEGYVRYTARYDERGNTIELAYFDEAGRPTPQKDGSAGYRADYDERGNCIAVVYFGREGRPARITEGYARYTARFDNRGNIVEMAYLDEAGRPTNHTDGYARYRAQFDERGNRTEVAYFDVNDRAVRRADGYARYTARFDDRGNVIATAYFDETGKPAHYGDGYTKESQAYDDHDRLIEDVLSGYDASTLGYSQRRRKYDEHGRIVEVANLDAAGDPAQDADGHARWTSQYDAEGHLIEAAFFNKEGRPAPYEDGYTSWRKTYTRGKLVKQLCVGYSTTNPFAQKLCKYNEKELWVELDYLDAAGGPARHKDGNTRATRTYDAAGKPVEETYWGYKPDSAFARVVARLDNQGRAVEFTYFDAADKPARHAEGFRRKTRSYDAAGKAVADTYWGYDGGKGFTRIDVKLDEREWGAEYTYFDAAGRPARHIDGFYRMTRKHDGRGWLLEEAYFDRDGRPANVAEGYARFTARFDDSGNEIERAYFDGAGEPTRHTDGNMKFARTYDEHNKVVEDLLSGFDAARLGYFQRRRIYDGKGRVTEVINLDVFGEPAHDSDGQARWTIRYDSDGREIERAFFDKQGKPAPFRDGHTAWRKSYEHGKLAEQVDLGFGAPHPFVQKVYKYNEKELWAVETFFDAAGKPARDDSGYLRRERRYDGSGKPVEETYLGYDGAQGYVTELVKLNERAQGSENTYFDAMGKPVRHKNGYLKWNRTYNPSGSKTEDIYSGYDGRDGFARMVVKLNEKGLAVENTYYDAAGTPVRHVVGYLRFTRTYDESGKPVEHTYWGYDEAEYGFVRMVARLDEKGREVEETYLDAAGRPARHKGGYARKSIVYDDQGRRIDAHFLDVVRLPVKPLVVQVMPGSAAAQLGFKKGDTILRYDGEDATNALRFIARRRAEKDGDPPRELVVLRGKQVLKFQVRSGSLGVRLDDRVVKDDPSHSAAPAETVTTGR